MSVTDYLSYIDYEMVHKYTQVGQLSQTNRAVAWVSFGKNVSEKSVHLTSLCYTAQNIFQNAETFRRVHQ